MTQGIAKKTVRGVFVTAGGQTIAQLLRLLFMLLLAKFLSPEDFGLIAMVAVFAALASLAGDLGLTAALIQRDKVEEIHCSSVFWLNTGVGLCLFLLLVAGAPLIAEFYDEPDLSAIVSYLSLTLLLQPLAQVHQTLMTRELLFEPIVISELISTFIGGAVGVVMAVQGYGVWSIVGYTLVGSLVRVPLLWGYSNWKPSLSFSWDAIQSLWQFSMHLLVFNFVNYFTRNLDRLLIGKILGAESLGYYAMANNIMLIPLRQISGSIGKVLFPALSRIQSDVEAFTKAYLFAVKSISLITFPMMLGFIVCAPELIRWVLGNQWEEVVILAQVLAVAGMLQSIGTTVGSVYLAVGRSDIMLKWAMFAVPVVVGSILWGMQWGIHGVVVSYTLASAFLWLISHEVANRLISLSMRKFLVELWPATVSAFIMFFAMILLKGQLIGLADVWMLLFLVVFGTSVYCFSLWLGFRSDVLEVISVVKRVAH